MNMRNIDEEVRTPKYAHFERERRWLIDAAQRPDLTDLGHLMIEDRYIQGSRFRLRRVTDSASGQTALKLTRKYEADDPLARPIVTAYLTEAEYALFAALPGHPLSKRRFHVEDATRMFNIDQFLGPLNGLELTEIEQADDASLRTLMPPRWAGLEVSQDPRYQGGTLAALGIPKD